MRLLIAAALAIAALAGPARAETCKTVTFTLTSSGASTPSIDNRTLQCVAWRITYYRTGFSDATVEFERSEDSSGTPTSFASFAGGEIVEGSLPMTTESSTAVTRAMYPWIRANVSSATGSGKIVIVIIGVKGTEVPPADTGGGGGSSGPVWGPDAVGAAPTEPPVQAGNFDGTNVRRTLGDTGGRSVVVGGSADGAAVTGAAVPVAGIDGSGNKRTVKTNTNGAQAVAAATTAAAGKSTASTQPVNDAGNSAPVEMYPYAFNGGTFDPQFVCTSQAPISATGSGNTEIVALTAAQVIHVCHISLSAASGVAVKFTQGTGSNCGTGTADITGAYQNVTTLALDLQPTASMRTGSGNALCINLGTGVVVGGFVVYAKF